MAVGSAAVSFDLKPAASGFGTFRFCRKVLLPLERRSTRGSIFLLLRLVLLPSQRQWRYRRRGRCVVGGSVAVVVVVVVVEAAAAAASVAVSVVVAVVEKEQQFRKLA